MIASIQKWWRLRRIHSIGFVRNLQRKNLNLFLELNTIRMDMEAYQLAVPCWVDEKSALIRRIGHQRRELRNFHRRLPDGPFMPSPKERNQADKINALESEVSELKRAMQTFCDKVDRGEMKSPIITYARFRQLLKTKDGAA